MVWLSANAAQPDADGRAAGRSEARAAHHRRVLEAERDVVERVQIDEPLVSREVALERVWREGAGLRCDLLQSIARHRLVGAAVNDARDVEDEPAQRRHRHELLERGVELRLARHHLVVEQARVLLADLLRRTTETHLEDVATLAGVGRADTPKLTIARDLRRRRCGQRRRRHASAEHDAEVDQYRQQQHNAEGDELLLVTAVKRRFGHSGGWQCGQRTTERPLAGC